MIQFENTVKRFGGLILTELKEKGITCWIAGGCLRDYFAGQPLKTDIDMFFPNQAEFDKTKLYLLEMGAKLKWESGNGAKLTYKNHTYDLVKKYFTNPKDTIDAFDFTVSMFAVDSTQVYNGETSFIDLSKRQLMINKITFPASTMRRAFRYYEKGFRMCAGEMKKMAEAIKGVESTNESQPVEPTEIETSGDTMIFFLGID